MRSLNYALAFMSLLMFSQESITAQAPTPSIVDVPPSPNAAALGEYGKVPVGLFTGTVEENIPLYTISIAKFSLPISLNYRSNGVMVRDAGSNVGLGWTLNAGGIITRTLRDERDEWISSRIVPPAANFDSQQMSDFLYSATSANTLDGEPDIFSFNFGNYSGRFYLTGSSGSMQAVLLDPSPLKIEFLPEFYSNNIDLPQIRITGPDGIIYLFGGLYAVEQNTSKTYGGSGSHIGTATVRTAWSLTKIILLNNEEINFSYSIRNLFYDAGIAQTVSSVVTNSYSTGLQYSKASHTLPVITRVNSAASTLTSIDWTNGKIDFTYSPRFDANSSMQKIDKMTIYTKPRNILTPLKQYQLIYLLAATNPVYNNRDDNGIFTDNHKRLFLTNLITASAIGSELNRYTFEYYNPTDLPTRLSYSIDHWGYFNGGDLNGLQNKDLVTKDVSFYNPNLYQALGSYPKTGSPSIIDAFAPVGGNKIPNAQFGIKGLLKKITYPTGGYSNLEYEPHVSGMELQLPLKRIQLDWSNPNSNTTVLIPFDQRVELFPSISYVTTSCDKVASPKVSYILSIKEVQSNTFVSILRDGQTAPTPLSIGAPGTGSRYFVDFKKGKSYVISIDVTTSCLNFTSTLTFSYNDTEGYYKWVQNKPIGGMRISKVITGDLTGNEQIKRYYYATDFSCLTCSSGKARITDPEPAISYYEMLTIYNGEELRSLTANLTSESLNDLYNSQGYHISYATVIEGIGNNFEGGAIAHNFNYVAETLPTRYRDPVIGTPFNNVFGNGEETKTTYYKNNNNTFVKVKEITNTYISDNRLSNNISAFRATRRSYSYNGEAITYNLSLYSINSQWRYLSSTSETTYDQNGSIGSTTATFYEYGNPLHLQTTGIKTILENTGASNQHALYKKQYFPQDYSFPGTLTGTAAIIKTMVDKHIWNIPIEQLNYSVIGSTNRLTGGNLTTYKMNGSIVTKDKDYMLKSNNATIYQDLISVTPATINSSGLFVYDSHYEPLNSYNRYDVKNNVLELTDRKNTYSLIRHPLTGDVWAKVINSNFNNIAYSNFEHGAGTTSAFTNWNYNIGYVISASYHNGTRAYNTSGSITSLLPLTTSQTYKVSFWRKIGGSVLNLKAGTITLTPKLGPQRNGWQYVEATFTGVTSLQIYGNYIIDELRLYPVVAKMNSYTYTDGVGVTSECNENNQKTSFEYDEFNRLKFVKDQDENIVKKYEYKYQHIQN